MLSNRLRPLLACLAVAATLAFVAGESIAAPKFNAGSRGVRTNSAPPPTATAPNSARPIERTMTQPNASAAARQTAPAAPGGFFNRFGLLGGLAGGLLGAGLIGMLLGHGFLGGLGGIASIFGLILQVGIIALIGMLVWRWWQGRSQPAAASAGGPTMHQIASPPDPRTRMNFGAMSGFGASAKPVVDTPIEINPSDFDAFERTLGEIQTAYGAEDLGALRARMTPEMLTYYAEELAKNASRGVVNQISNVKLLQGDLAEAWRESNEDYATVAMRYALTDRTLDRASGRVVEGNDQTQEALELWTFRRSGGGQWLLSAVQQAH